MTSLDPIDNTIISSLSFFRDIDPAYISPILKKCEIRSIKQGEIVLNPGIKNSNLYWLLSGGMRVYLSPNISSSSSIDRQLGFDITPGESFGEMSIIDDSPVSACVVAIEDSYLLAMPEQVFWEQLVYLPGIVKNLLKGLSHRLRQRDELSRKNLEQQLRFEYLEKDLSAARQIQANILPHDNPLFPNHLQADVFALIQPAKEVGGDFFDAFPLDEKNICIAVGDVSGKGIAAALFMIRVITLLRISMSTITPLGLIVHSINLHLCEGNDNCMFATMFVGILDVTSGELTYVSGGHNWPFICRHSGSFDLLAPRQGVLLGIDELARYDSSSLVLQSGDTLVLYTDGVTEAENENGDFFTSERAIQLLNDHKNAISSKEIASNLYESVAQFSRSVPQSDDITILVLRYQESAI